MKFPSYFLVAIVVSASIVSCNQSKKEEPAVRPTTTTKSDSATTLLVRAAESCILNLAQTRVATDNAVTPELRTLGSHLNTTQQSVLNEIARVAAAKNIDVPDSLSGSQKVRMRRLKTGSIDDDKRLVIRMQTEYRNQSKFLKYLSTVSDSELNAMATSQLTVVQTSADTLRSFKTKQFGAQEPTRARRKE
jgi:hypothetical protein